MKLGRTLFSSFVVVGIAGCSLAMNLDREQCLVAADCVRGLGAGALCVERTCIRASATENEAGDIDAAPVDPKWGCIGKMPVVASDPNVPISYTVRFITALSEQPLVGLDWAVCSGLDTACSAPFATGTTDQDGILAATLYKGFRGYFSLRPTPSVNVKPAILYFVPPETDVVVGSIETQIHLLSEAEFSFIAASMQKPIDADTGHVFGFAFDCQLKAASGVRAFINPVGPKTFGYYSDQNRSPSSTLESTSSYAEGGFLNVPVGSFTMTASRFDTGDRIGTITGYVRKGEITYAPMQPTPL